LRRVLIAGLAVLVLTCRAQAAAETAVDRAIAQASNTFRVPQSWIRAVIEVESGGNAGALSRSGAIGLMQLMPNTWSVLRERLHLGRDPYDSHDNVMAGTALLRELYDRFGPGGFLAAYNASPERYLAYITQGKPLTDETRAYLTHIAPLLGDADLGRAVAAPGTSPNWQVASLFVASPAVALQAVDTSSASNANARSGPIPWRFQPQSGGLFAALSEGPAP
jgi:hypothetical protein